MASQPVHPADGVQFVGHDVRPRGIDVPVLNVNGNNTPQDDPGAADLDGRVHAAFECDMCLSQAHRLHDLRRRCGESGTR
jgi:hypothetical protein